MTFRIPSLLSFGRSTNNLLLIPKRALRLTSSSSAVTKTKTMSTSTPSSTTSVKQAGMEGKNDELPRIVDMKSLAEYILHPKCQSICILTGAGASCASGIPDFRSPGGLYDALRPDLLTATQAQRHILSQDPTHVVSWELFQDNPLPYMEVRRPFILGTQAKRWKPTIAHRFAELLHTKTTTVNKKDNGKTTTSTDRNACSRNSSSSSSSTSKLKRVYTCNIDGLDHLCDDVPSSKIVNVHGRISNVACEGCQATMDFDEFCDKVKTQIKDIYGSSSAAPSTTTADESTEILCPTCGQGLVKPTTVLFGRSLPSDFFERIEDDMPTTDLLIVAGTSLVVSPANSLVNLVPKRTPRVIFNLQPVGKHLGLKYNNSGEDPSNLDFYQEGECDALFLKLIEELGWMDDLVSKMDVLPPKSQKLVRERMNATRESI